MEIALSGIERKADHVRQDAESLGRYLRRLTSLPGFETKAEAAVTRAELALTEALLAVKLAKSTLARLRQREAA